MPPASMPFSGSAVGWSSVSFSVSFSVSALLCGRAEWVGGFSSTGRV
jgi:hypothetical protein